MCSGKIGRCRDFAYKLSDTIKTMVETYETDLWKPEADRKKPNPEETKKDLKEKAKYISEFEGMELTEEAEKQPKP